MPSGWGLDTVSFMDVTFTKMSGRRYLVTVVRERGPKLAPRQGPGYHACLPHDAVHFLVEAEAGLAGGVFGRIAAGQSNLFWAADPALRRATARREARRAPSPVEHADMELSERLASVCQPMWEFRTGRRAELPPWSSMIAPDAVDPSLVERVVTRLDAFAQRWHPLPVGGGVTLTWPVGRQGGVPSAAPARRDRAAPNRRRQDRATVPPERSRPSR
jgi:hypothetical protein